MNTIDREPRSPEIDGASALTNTVFVLLSFEGPDAYSLAGGLGTRVSSLALALAEEGYETHLFFVGAPEAPGCETRCAGRLHLHRWCQWISRFHPAGVYDGELGKVNDWNVSLPPWLADQLLAGLVASGRTAVVIAEEWHTSWSVVKLARTVRARGWSGRVRCFWNANNTFGFEHVPWANLSESVAVTTVSRFMKHEMRPFGVDPLVLPNGIASQWLEGCDHAAVRRLGRSMPDRLLLAKIARWDPDKRWLMALDSVAQLRALGVRPLLMARGGMESHGREVMEHAQWLGLSIRRVRTADDTAAALCQGLEHAQSDIVLVETPLSRPQLQLLYRSSAAVLANSGFEPFGLVGLEAMACGGLSFVGSTGEDYATPGVDAISVQTSSPAELVGRVMALRQSPGTAACIRRAARRTAARFTWPEVIRNHLAPLTPPSSERVRSDAPVPVA